jgi:hypothetical protein
MKPPWWKHYPIAPRTQPILEPLPEAKQIFEIGDCVRLKDKPDKARRIVDIRWHRYRHQFVYYMEVSGDSWRAYWFAAQLIAGTTIE